MKITWKKYEYGRDKGLWWLSCLPKMKKLRTKPGNGEPGPIRYPLVSVDGSSGKTIGAPQSYGNGTFGGFAVEGELRGDQPAFRATGSYSGGVVQYGDGVRFYNCVFKNITGWLLECVNMPYPYVEFYNCVFDGFRGRISHNWTQNISPYSTVIRFIKCIVVNSDFGRCNAPLGYSMENCIVDRKYEWGEIYIPFGSQYRSYGNIVGNPMFVSTDIDDLWSYGNGEYFICGDEKIYTDHNPDGNGYRRLGRVFGDDYDALGLSEIGLYPFTRSYVNYPQIREWTPDYPCSESKQMILHNLQNYVDLDGVRRSYFGVTFTEIMLDFTKNGLSKKDMQCLMELLAHRDNEVRIYPNEDDDQHYIVGNISRENLQYSKLTEGYWDSGKIDKERFNGIALKVRVTDGSHWTEV